jgi:hypothetical protein
MDSKSRMPWPGLTILFSRGSTGGISGNSKLGFLRGAAAGTAAVLAAGAALAAGLAAAVSGLKGLALEVLVAVGTVAGVASGLANEAAAGVAGRAGRGGRMSAAITGAPVGLAEGWAWLGTCGCIGRVRPGIFAASATGRGRGWLTKSEIYGACGCGRWVGCCCGSIYANYSLFCRPVLWSLGLAGAGPQDLL